MTTIAVDRNKLADILKSAMGDALATSILAEITVTADADIDFVTDEVRVYLGSGDWGAVYVNGELWMERHHDDIRERIVEEIERQFDLFIEYNNDAYRRQDPENPRQIACGTLAEVKANEKELYG